MSRSDSARRADAGEDEHDVVLAVPAQCLGHSPAGGVERRARARQGGAERRAQLGQAGVDRPDTAFHQAVGVEGYRGPWRQREPGLLEDLGADAA